MKKLFAFYFLFSLLSFPETKEINFYGYKFSFYVEEEPKFYSYYPFQKFLSLEFIEGITNVFNPRNNESKFFIFYNFLRNLKEANYENIGNLNAILNLGLSSNSFSYYLMQAADLLGFGGILAERDGDLTFFIKLSEKNPEKIYGYILDVQGNSFLLIDREIKCSGFDYSKNFRIEKLIGGKGFSFYNLISLPDFPFDKNCEMEANGKKITFKCSSYLSDYLSPLNQGFNLSLMIGVEEVKKMEIAKKIKENFIGNEIKDVNFVYRLVANKPYEPKDLTSVSKNLIDGFYDCDNGSLLLASILLNLGYKRIDILIARYEYPPHLFILLKPKEKKNEFNLKSRENVCYINHKGRNYFALDSRLIKHSSDGDIISIWGDCNGEEYKRMPDELYDVTEVYPLGY